MKNISFNSILKKIKKPNIFIPLLIIFLILFVVTIKLFKSNYENLTLDYSYYQSYSQNRRNNSGNSGSGTSGNSGSGSGTSGSGNSGSGTSGGNRGRTYNSEHLSKQTLFSAFKRGFIRTIM